MSDAKIGQGDVKITLCGEEKKLKCTWEAAAELSTFNGGLTMLNTALVRMDFNAVAAVIRWGLDIDLNEARKKVFETGIVNLWLPCSEFVINLSNGGKPPRPVTEDGSAPQ